jgi:hypothetical protein
MPQLDLYIWNVQIFILLFFVLGYVLFLKFILPIIIFNLKWESLVYYNSLKKFIKAGVISKKDYKYSSDNEFRLYILTLKQRFLRKQLVTKVLTMEN